jgi:hypothetical protein
MENMDQNQAINVLVQAAQVAQSKGAFTLQEAVTIAKAIEAFTPAKESSEEVASEVKKVK